MDFDSSTKFISSLAKFLQSLCNGYVEFDNGVEVIGHIYLSVDTGKKIDYILNEKVCKTDENSVTFISNSFHAQPAEKPKPVSKPAKAADQDKTSDPDGSHDDEIVILDEPENRLSNTNSSCDKDNNIQQHSTSKPSHPPSASKRSYHQSFHQKNKSSVPQKQSRPNSSVHNPNGALETDSHLERSNSSSNFLTSQALPSDPSISTATGADMSHPSQVFPQTSSDTTNNSSSALQNIKQEPGGEYDVNVKQEFDSSAHRDEEQGAYDEDQSGYGGMYEDEYFSNRGGDQSQRHVDYGQMAGMGQGEYYQGAPGTSDGVGGDSSGKMLGPLFKMSCPVPQCQNSQFRDTVKFKRHWKEKQEEICVAYSCNSCQGCYSRRESLLRHARLKHGLHSEAVAWAETVQPVYQENRLFVDPFPFNLNAILGTLFTTKKLAST